MRSAPGQSCTLTQSGSCEPSGRSSASRTHALLVLAIRPPMVSCQSWRPSRPTCKDRNVVLGPIVAHGLRTRYEVVTTPAVDNRARRRAGEDGAVRGHMTCSQLAPVRTRAIPALLRQILRASISTPLALASAGCAGSDHAACSTPPLEGGELDDATASDAAAACLRYTLPVTGDPAACGLVALDCHPTGGPVTSAALCATLCHQQGAACWLGSNDTVSCVVGQCSGGACCGRRPPGLKLGAASGHSVVGRWFAELAAREAASVEAFSILHAELASHRAPRRLLAGARRAARDEVRHARVIGLIASRFGGKSHPPRIEHHAIRSLEAIATENAAEGCVRETFGALVGMWQARFASDEQVRKAMSHIARDETRHAALSWDVADWIERRLGQSARRKVEVARRVAIAELDAEISHEPAPEIVRQAGVPSGRAARLLLSQVRDSLWRPMRATAIASKGARRRVNVS